MKNIFFVLILFSEAAFGLDAVVTVLEAPLFKEKSYDAPVVQYLRKGDVFKIHPSIGNNTSLDHHSPSPQKLAKLKKKLSESPEWKQDPLFQGVDNTAYLEDEFIPTWDRQGNIVYVLSAHIYVYLDNSKELNQNTALHDPTDYRLEEPLPKNYPLFRPIGYRGQFLMGLTQPYFESYPYLETVRTKGYMSPLDMNLTLLKQAPDRPQDRFFIGGTLNLRYFTNNYSFSGDRTSEETAIKVGLGPTFTYDAFKGQKNRVALTGSVIVNLFNQITIEQASANQKDSRVYRAYTLSPRLGLQYHRKQILEDVDFVVGSNLEVESAGTFRAKNAATQVSWWRHGGSDKFNTRMTFSLSGYVGIQSAY